MKPTGFVKPQPGTGKWSKRARKLGEKVGEAVGGATGKKVGGTVGEAVGSLLDKPKPGAKY